MIDRISPTIRNEPVTRIQPRPRANADAHITASRGCESSSAKRRSTKAARLVSSLRIGAVALRQERESVTIDGPQAVADLCVEMRFFDREVLRVVLLNAKQKLIDVATVSQGSVNESLAHPREVFKPAIVISAYSFIMVHNL